ncbi:MAG: hypothetical protein NPMRIOTA_120016 [Nitrosopumilales archaeon]|nr:MAG: hypothetical protein NPMRIOTA_120016 [Nitrosopumilales archaeon]
MNRFLVTLIILGIVATIISIPLMAEQLVDAKSRKKVHFTQTVTSSQDPGQGHEDHQLAIILPPNEGTIYDGSLTYVASEPVQIVVLHEISKDDDKGQPTWTVDGNTVYGLTLVDPNASSGSFEFTGAALALHTTNTNSFTTTVSVDGWIRGQPLEVIIQSIEVPLEPTFPLSRANVPAIIPMHVGFFEEEPVYYIITDSNDDTLATQITEQQGWQVEVAPPLSKTPDTALDTVYVFTNGLVGDGIYGFQSEVFSSTPTQTDEYSAVRSVVEVDWVLGKELEVIDSVEKILEAEEADRIKLEKTDVILNTPQVVWPDGQMSVKEDKTLTDDTPYGGGQVLDIDTDNMTVTFVAHRGWGPDGKTIYYIVTDATPTGPADMMGVVDAPKLAQTFATAASVDLFQFKNGIKGSGPLGFQPGIAASAPGDENYSPLWRISLISWNDPNVASILETIDDINSMKSDDKISVELARPMKSDHIVNCPFIDPFQ